MDVSEFEATPGGHELIEALVALSGLPESWVRKELDPILERFGQNSGHLTLDQLREIMAEYLETLKMDYFSEAAPQIE